MDRWQVVRIRPEAGSTIPLVLGFFVIAALMIFGAVTASAAFLAQRDLAAVCDGAAVAAAQSVDPTALYASPTAAGAAMPARLPLDATAVDAALARYVAAGGYSADADGLTVTGGVAGDGSTAMVRCTRTVALPFSAVFGLPDGVVRTAVASARSPVLARS